MLSSQHGAPITNEPPITSHQNNHQPQHWLITKNQQLNINHRDSAQRAMEIQYRGAKYIPDRINILSIKESVQLYLVSISRRSVNSVQLISYRTFFFYNSVQLISHTVHFFFTTQDLKKNVSVSVKNRVRQSRNSNFNLGIVFLKLFEIF